MHINIIGAGAMGCLYGAHLADRGHDITLVDIREDIVSTINSNGLRVDGVGGDYQIGITAVTPDADIKPADAVFLQVHTSGTVAAAKTARRLVAHGGYAVTFQNGIGNIEALVDALGEANVIGGVSRNSATLAGPGHATHTNAGPTLIGELDGSNSGRVTTLQSTLNDAGFETEITDNIMGVVWGKFIENCAINPVCAVTSLLAGEILTTPEAGELQDKLVEEILMVVAAKGITFSGEDPVAHAKSVTAMVKPSMQQHMDTGRLTEIDAINGALVREAEALGIDTPYNKAITLLVKARNAHTMGDHE